MENASHMRPWKIQSLKIVSVLRICCDVLLADAWGWGSQMHCQLEPLLNVHILIFGQKQAESFVCFQKRNFPHLSTNILYLEPVKKN
jgi:hypothetical protein